MNAPCSGAICMIAMSAELLGLGGEAAQEVVLARAVLDHVGVELRA